MGKEDYATAGGGPLKLKGVKDGRIEKKKKKKKEKEKEKEKDTDSNKEHEQSAKSGSEGPGEYGKPKSVEVENAKHEEDKDEEPPLLSGRTEAERKFEEKRRKRLEEKFLKEGVKSHKERVAEFNKYLANLSEHHDMPRIGPG